MDISSMLPVELEDLKIEYIPVYHSSSKINGIGVFTPIDLGIDSFIGVSHVFYKGFWYMTTHGNYNHSENSNCSIETDGNILIMRAKENIKRNSELVVDYREQPFLEKPQDDWVK